MYISFHWSEKSLRAILLQSTSALVVSYTPDIRDTTRQVQLTCTRLGNDRAATHVSMFSLFCFRATVLSFPGKSCHARSSQRYAAKDLTKGSRIHVIGSGSSAITCKLMPRHLSAHWADAALLPSRCRRRSCNIHPTYDLSHLRDTYERAGFRDSQVTSPSIVTSKSRWGADALRIVCCCQR